MAPASGGRRHIQKLGYRMYPAAAGGEREAKVTPFAGSHEGRGRMPDPEF
jgi:hypothetical protein